MTEQIELSEKYDRRAPDVDPKELSREIARYQETGIVSLNLSYLMRNVAHKMAMSRKWCHFPPHMLEDMESEAFLWMVRWAIKSAKPEGNVFSYLMCAANSAFCRYLHNQERNERSKEAFRQRIAAECGKYAKFESEDNSTNASNLQEGTDNG